MIIRAAPREHYNWIRARCGLSATQGFKAIEAITPEGEIKAMTGYDLWTLNAVQMSVAVDDPKVFMGRGFLHACFAYPFIQAKLGMVYTVTAGDNAASLRLQEGLGFRDFSKLPDGWAPGVDLVLKVMKRDDCRWLHRIPTEA